MAGADLRLIYVTVGTRDDALAIATVLLSERLIACANVLDGATSLYWWQGRVQSDSEAVMVAKTQDRHVPAVIERVRSLHKYECPCVVSLPIENGNPAFLQWVIENTSTPS